MNKTQIIDYLKQNKPYFHKQYGIKVLGLYGSYARDEANNESDVDIFYERERNFPINDGLEFWQLDEKIARGLKVKKVDLVKLSSMNPVIKYYAKKDFIYV